MTNVQAATINSLSFYVAMSAKFPHYLRSNRQNICKGFDNCDVLDVQEWALGSFSVDM